jgi:glycosyltransferase involved in cell wall biosynthesis
MGEAQIRAALRALLEEAGVEFTDIRVSEFPSTIGPKGVTGLDLQPYCSERIVQFGYRRDSKFNFLIYPQHYQDVCLRHEVCEIIVNGLHCDILEFFQRKSDYFTLAFIEFLVHKEFQHRYKEHVPVYRNKWAWEMDMYTIGRLNVEAIESNISTSVYSFVALLIFIPEKLKHRFDEVGRLDVYNRMYQICESYGGFYQENKDKSYEEKLRLLQQLRNNKNS